MITNFQQWTDNNDFNEKNGNKGNVDQQNEHFLHAEEKNKQYKSANVRNQCQGRRRIKTKSKAHKSFHICETGDDVRTNAPDVTLQVAATYFRNVK